VKRRHGPRLSALGLTLIAAAALAGPGPQQQPDARRSASRLAGEVDAAGLQRVVAREKGRVVLLNFWATWCVPCREEFPELGRLQTAYRTRGLSVIGVSTDLASQRVAVEDFLRKLQPPFANYVKKPGGDDQQFIDAVERSWGGELPFTVLYDRSGKKAKVLSGRHSFAEYEKEIQRLLGW
jgi:thiol-disulfide isomerase/thioredoxin